MKHIFFTANTTNSTSTTSTFDIRQLRSGWWILIFIGLVALTRPIYKPIKQFFTDLGFTAEMLEPTSFLLILLVTWICLKLRKESLNDVGLAINKKWLTQFFTGTLMGITMLAATVGIIWAFGGVTFELNAERSLNVLSYGLYLFLIGSLLEELLHRGFIFQRLIDGIGFWGAQFIIASLFALGHSGNPGMEDTTFIIASLDLFIVSLIFGLAYFITKSLALPIGLHLGWNWSQGNILGFGVSGHEHTGWFTPILNDKAQWVTGGEFGPEASIASLVVGLVVFVLFIAFLPKSKLDA